MKDIRKLQSFFSLETLSDVLVLSVADYMRFYKEQKLAEESLNGLIRNLHSFFSWMQISSYVSEDYSFFKVRFGNKKYVDSKLKRRDVLTPEEEDKIIEAGRNRQEKLMIALMLKTALRRSAIANIKMADIEGCEIKVTEKGDEEITVYLTDTLCSMLSEYVAKERNTDSEYLFYGVHGVDGKEKGISGNSVNERVKSAAKRAGITKKITAHRLRATRITNVAYKYGDRAAQSIANHKSPNTLNRYVRRDEVALRNIMREE